MRSASSRVIKQPGSIAMPSIISWKQLASNTISSFFADKGARLGAALAFYMAFSVAPLLIIAASVASLFFGADAVEGQLNHQLTELLGIDVAEGIRAMLAAAQKAQHSGTVSSIIGVGALIFGATFVFSELKDSMNTIWGIELRPEIGFWTSIKENAPAFLMVAVIALLLLVSMVLTTLFTTLSRTINLPASAQITDFLVSSSVTTLLFASMFKYLPDAKILWRDVWFGAGATAVLFVIGKYLIGLYLANTQMASAYGAASSILMFMLWTFYSAQILFLGVEFTQVHAQMHGRTAQPTANARLKPCDDRAHQSLQGIPRIAS
jgi:membrane protein